MENTNTTPSSPSLDPQAVNLAKAIRQVESSGNFEAKGKSGEYGAYQFMPDTWASEAKQAGVSTPLDKATPEEQNKVAYTKIKQLKDQGMNVGQIASTWNSGNPEAYQQNHVGVNSKGVSYDTPAYATKVAQAYQSIKGDQPIPPDVSNIKGATESSHGMPNWEKWALGLGIPLTIAAGAFTGGASEALVPEEIAALAGATGEASLGSGAAAAEALPTIEFGAGTEATNPGLLSKIGSGIKSVLGNKVAPLAGLGTAEGLAQAVGNKILGNKSTPEQVTQGSTVPQQTSSPINLDQEALADQNTVNNAYKALNASLQNTPTGKVLSSNPETQQTLQYMAMNGYLPDTSQGVNDFTGANTKANENVSKLSEGIQQVLDSEGGKGNVEDAIMHANATIDQYVPTHEREAAKKYVRELADSYKESYGDKKGFIPLSDLEKGKREQYNAVAKWDATRPSAKTAAHRALAKGFRSTIEQNTKHKDLYNRVMGEEQKIFGAKKLMKKLNAKKSIEHKGFTRGILKTYGKYVGTYFGDKIGGPLGAIVGTMVGDHLTKAVDKRFGKTYFESKEGRKLIELASKGNPKMAELLKKELRKAGVQAEKIDANVDPTEKDVPENKIYEEEKKLANLKGFKPKTEKEKKLAGLLKREVVESRLKQNTANAPKKKLPTGDVKSLNLPTIQA